MKFFRFFFIIPTIISTLFISIYGYEDELSVESTLGSLEGARLDEIVEKYIANITMYDPEKATLLGVHNNDYLLTNREYYILNKKVEGLKFLMKDLEKIDKDAFSLSRRIEYETLYSIIEKDIYEAENLNFLSLKPYYYLQPFDIVYFMLEKDYENYNLRASNALKRFSAIPDVLYQAERNLTRPPKIWTEYTIKRTELLINNIGDYYSVFRNYIGLDPTIKADFENTISKVKNSLIRYNNFLKNELLSKSDGKPYCGLYTYGFYLERWHGIDYNPRKALRIAKKNFNKEYKKLIDEAIKIAPDEYMKNGVKGVYLKVSGDVPKYDELIKYISDQIENAKNYFDEYKVVTFPTQRLLIKNIPQFMFQVYPTVFYYPSYPLDRIKASEFYIYVPQESDLTKNPNILLSLYSQPKIEFFISGLIIPGSHLKNDAMSNVSKIRKISDQPAIELGWLNYSEDLASEMGYFSSGYSKFLLSYVRALRRLRAYVDVAFHIEEMDFDEAVRLFVDKFQLTQEQAKDEVINISMNPTYYYAGMYGYDFLSNLRKKYVGEENKFFDMRNFHSDILGLGNISMENIAKELKDIRKKRLKKEIEEYDEE